MDWSNLLTIERFSKKENLFSENDKTKEWTFKKV